MHNKYFDYLILFFLLCLSYIYYLVFQFNTYIYDDAFITFRYANNFANGNGLVYNIGEYVYGSTSILYAVLLGCIKFLISSSSIHIIAQSVSLLFFNAIFIYIYYKNKINIIVIVFIYFFLFFNEYVNMTIFSGMETMFVIFILMFMISNYDKKIFYYLMPLLILCRIDVAFVLILSDLVIKFISFLKKEISLRVILKNILYLIAGTVIAFSVTYMLYGSIIPNTIIAKSIIYKGTMYDRSYWFRFNQMRNFGYPSVISIPIIAFIVISIFVIKYKTKKVDIKYLLPAIFSFVYLIFQVVFVSSPNAWYIPVLTFAVFMILTFLIDEIKKKRIVVYVFLVIVILFNIINNYKYHSGIFKYNNNSVYNCELYKVSQMIPKNSKIFCGDIGVIGYFDSDSYIYDCAGLVSPKANQFNKEKMDYGAKGITTDYRAIIKQIEIEKPDYANFRDYPFFEYLKKDTSFNSKYELIYKGDIENLYKKK